MSEYEKVDETKLTDNISVVKSVHPVWKEWRMMRDMEPSPLTLHKNTPIIGQYHYMYMSKKGEISLVELPDYFLDGVDWWEAMALKGPEELTHEEMRFRSKEEAEEEIKKLLD